MKAALTASLTDRDQGNLILYAESHIYMIRVTRLRLRPLVLQYCLFYLNYFRNPILL